MKILMVIDQFYSANNGMTISSRRFAAQLRSLGHEVRIASTGSAEDLAPGETAYLMPVFTVPVFDRLISAQGMTFARTDKEKLRQAVEWADLVHVLVPFGMSRKAVRLAHELHKPCTAAFHVQPENITSSIHMGNLGWLNSLIYRGFNSYIYKDCPHIHCPSRFIAGELERHGYKSTLHVISNGIDPDFCPKNAPRPEKQPGEPFNVLMVGRLSIEKRQDVLLRAVAKSAHKNEIRVYLAGKGPREKHLRALAEKLGLDVVFGFYPKEELLRVIGRADLYVHAAAMEIEAMSCMEAFACGRVPVIADSRKSATPQFALDERSLFPVGDTAALAKKIDWWLEHPAQRLEMEGAYADLAGKYRLADCVRQAEAMFMQAKEECENHAG